MLATDLTPASDRAFDRAIQLATEWNAMLTVCHVVEASSMRPWGIERRIKNAETELERLLRGSKVAPAVKISRHVIFGDPAERVVEHAGAIATDFLITGPAQVKVLGEKLFGSTAARILRHARQPVLAVRRREEGPYHKVTVSVDFSDASRHAYFYGRTLFPDAKFSVIHAYEVSPDWGGPNTNKSMDIVEAEEKERVIRVAQQDMADLAAAGDVPRLQYQTVLEQGTPEAVLVDHVEKQWPDLVVAGTHGRTGLQQAAIGSVTERFLHVLPCDVLAARPL
jgi:nucleotide-binding universal stress UspA family protein